MKADNTFFPVPPCISLADLLEKTVAFIRRFILLSAAQAVVLALWIAHCHAFEAVDITPYIWVTSPEKRSGKSRTKEVVSLLVPRAWKTEHATPAAIYRKVHNSKPTLFLDEIDSALGGSEEYVQALRGLLNSGFERGGAHSLCVGQGANQQVVDFLTFCPKMILGIGKTLPETVRDRSICIRLERKAPNEKVERFRRRAAKPVAAELQAEWVMWCIENAPLLIAAEPVLPDTLNDRQQDVVEPLVAIADMAGPEWASRCRAALVELLTGEEAEDDSTGVTMLRDCKTVFEEKDVTKLPSETLVKALNAMDTSPWARWNKGNGLTQNALAAVLKAYKIRPGQVWLSEEAKNVRGYKAEDFADAWSRYVPPPRKDAREVLEALEPAPVAAQMHFPRPLGSSALAPAKDEEKPLLMQVLAPLTLCEPGTGEDKSTPVIEVEL